MVKTRKFTALMLAFIMSFTCGIVSFATLATDVVDSKYEEAIETLGALEIMVGDAETGLFRPEESLKRSEFAKVSVHLLGLGELAENSKSPTEFPDVVENHWANGYINIAKEQGIIIGDDEGNFRPDDSISYAEAMTMLVRAADYEPSAEAKGGFPNGYIQVGSQIGISKNAAAGHNDAVKRGMVAQMTFNVLTVNMMEQVGFGNNASFEVVDKTILEDVLDVTKSSGQVIAVGASSISGTGSLSEDEVKIGDTVYEVSEGAISKVRNLLGFNVIFYVKHENNDDIVILARPENNKNSFIKISSENIENVINDENGTTLNYWLDRENDKDTEKADISKEAKLIFNGKATEFNKDLLIPDSGRVVLLDSDRDEVYDIVFVTSQENYVVEEIIKTSNRVVDKYGKPSLILDPDNKKVSFTITKGDKAITIDELSEWNVLSVAKSLDGSIINVEVSTNSVSGKVSEIVDEKIAIEGKEYEVAKNYPDEINLNDEGTFYLDVSGRIAAVDKSVALSSNYAYLTDAELTTGFDTFLEIKVLTKEGEIKILSSKNKLKLNDKTGVLPEEVLRAISDEEGNVISQLITIETNSNGELTKITTATDNTGSGAVNKNVFTKNAAGSFEYIEASKKLGEYNVDENTVVFDIPEGKTDTDEFSVETISLFEDDTVYDVLVYDLGEDMTAKAVVVTNSNGAANLEAPLAIVDSFTKTTNENDEVAEKIYVYENGEKKSYFAEDESLFTDSEGAKLQKGDMIQIKTNAKNEIEDIRILFRASSKDTEAKTVIDEDLYTVYGKVVKKFADSINVTVNDGSVVNFKTDGAVAYEFDSEKTKNAIKVIDTGDISAYDELEPERVFVKVYKNKVEEIVVVK